MKELVCSVEVNILQTSQLTAFLFLRNPYQCFFFWKKFRCSGSYITRFVSDREVFMLCCVSEGEFRTKAELCLISVHYVRLLFCSKVNLGLGLGSIFHPV